MSNKSRVKITSALEDYLETIFEVVAKKGVARVKDIAAARNVKPGSVSPALKRLSEAGHIVYNQGEFVTLTDLGNQTALKTITRHKLLYKFLIEILGVNDEDAENDACAMEHYLSDSSVNKLTSFFEFFQACPEGIEFLNKYRNCPMINGNEALNDLVCKQHSSNMENFKTLLMLEPGEQHILQRIQSDDATREKLINMGFIPGCSLFIEKKFSGSEIMSVKIDENIVEISFLDAEALLVR